MPSSILTVFDQAYAAVLDRVNEQRLTGATRLPPERELSADIGVSLVTVRRVLDRMAKQGLVSRQHGRGTFVRPRKSVSVIEAVFVGPSHALFDPYTAPIMRGIADQIRLADGFDLRVNHVPVTTSEGLGARLLKDVRVGEADGFLIVWPIRLRDCNALAASHVPFVTVQADFGRDDWPSVLPDYAAAGRMAARHLLSKGKQRISLIAGPIDEESITVAQAALNGLTDVLGAAAPLPRETALFTNRSREQGHDAMRMLLARSDRPDAVYAIGDEVALGAQEALREAGLDGRGDPLLVVSATDPAVWTGTVIEHPPLEDMGREAARLLCAIMSGGRPKDTMRRFAPRLTER